MQYKKKPIILYSSGESSTMRKRTREEYNEAELPNEVKIERDEKKKRKRKRRELANPWGKRLMNFPSTRLLRTKFLTL